LAHSKSALKRWRQSLARRDRNRSVKSRTRTLLNRALVTIGQDGSEEDVKAAVSALDKAAQQGVIHTNAAARSKSRLLKRFNLATAASVAAAAGSASEAEAPAKRPRRTAAPKAAAPKANAPKASAAKTTRSKAAKPAEEKAPRSRTRKST
jgi:small subunit ribosomal protein S20